MLSHTIRQTIWRHAFVDGVDTRLAKQGHNVDFPGTRHEFNKPSTVALDEEDCGERIQDGDECEEAGAVLGDNRESCLSHKDGGEETADWDNDEEHRDCCLKMLGVILLQSGNGAAQGAWC